MMLLAGACALFIAGTFRTRRDHAGAIAFITLVVAGLGLAVNAFDLSGRGAEKTLPLVLDHFAFFVKGLAIIAGLVLVLLSWEELPDRQAAEYHGCLLIIIAGL